MEKNIIQRMIDADIITEQDVEQYNAQKSSNLISKQVQEEKITYSIIEDGILIKFDERDLDNKGEYITPIGVHTIGSQAFENCDKLIKIELIENVVHIGLGAFRACRNLESVQMTNNVRNIQAGAFAHCHSLHNINISSNIKEIKSGTFYNCFNLHEIILPENLLQIGSRAFDGCINLNKINIPKYLANGNKTSFDPSLIRKESTRKFEENKDSIYFICK